MQSILLTICLSMAPFPSVEKSQEIANIKKELGAFTSLVGKWNGTATPQDAAAKRKREFWREKGDCQWSFEKDKSGLILHLKDGKQIQSATVRRSQDKDKPIQIQLVLADKREQSCRGGKARERRRV
jgi:hypothetical protein